jgi:CRP-like cAMP-binding protein
MAGAFDELFLTHLIILTLLSMRARQVSCRAAKPSVVSLTNRRSVLIPPAAANLLHAHLLARVPITDEDFSFLLSFIHPVSLAKKQHHLLEGDVCTYLTFVTQGCLRSYTIDAAGEEHTLQFALEDWWISDFYSLLTVRPSTLNIDALEDTQMLLIRQADMETIYAQAPVFERLFRLLMQNRYLALQERVNAALSETASEKYNHFIQKYRDLTQRIPQHYIASYLGIKPESLSRVRRQNRLV